MGGWVGEGGVTGLGLPEGRGQGGLEQGSTAPHDLRQTYAGDAVTRAQTGGDDEAAGAHQRTPDVTHRDGGVQDILFQQFQAKVQYVDDQTLWERGREVPLVSEAIETTGDGTEDTRLIR